MNIINIKNKSIWQKAKIKLVPFVLTSVSILGGCTAPNSLDSNNKVNTGLEFEKDVNLDSNSGIINYNNQVDSEINQSINSQLLNTSFVLADDDIDTLINNINEIRVEYKESDLFNIDNCLNDYYSLPESTYGDCVLIRDNKVDANELYNQVIDNNKQYNQEYNFGSYTSDLTEDELIKVINILSDNINKQLSINSKIDIKELDYKLKNLKIFAYQGMGSAKYNALNNMISFNFSMIDTIQKRNAGIDVLEMTVKHETNHLIQALPLKDNGSFDSNYGICYHFKNESVNSLYYNFLFEGSSEKTVVNDYNDNRAPLVYDYSISCIESLTLSTILNENNNYNSIENNMMQHDLDQFLNVFSISNDDEKKEILKMLYATELIYFDNDEFAKAYKQKYNTEYDYYAKNNLSNSLSESIAITLSKQFYKNLLTQINNQSVKINDIFALVSIFEDDLNKITWYSNNPQGNESLINQYQKIQIAFFNAISEKTNYSTSEIVSEYQLFHKNKVQNINISWLSQEKKSFFNKIMESRINNRGESLSRYFDFTKNNELYSK